ncbi:unnamed protein product, partial [marine sediment metagenome]
PTIVQHVLFRNQSERVLYESLDRSKYLMSQG